MGLTANPRCIFCLQNDKNLASTKLKAFADDKFIVAIMMISVFDRVENIVEKTRKCWIPAFSPFPTMFSKGFLYRVTKVMIVWWRFIPSKTSD